MPRASTAPLSARKIAALTLATATAAFGLTLAQAAPSAAAAETQTCPAPGEFPGVDNSGYFATDSNINVFVGGDYLAAGGAAETEGMLVVAGSATFESGFFNIGTVGVGSGLYPEAMSDMLIVGGDIVVVGESKLDVGFPFPEEGFAGGGNVIAGGQITGESKIETNGGSLKANEPNALGDFADFGAAIVAESEGLAALTGTPGDVDGSRVTFTGDGSDDLQVFTVNAADLTTVSEVYYASVGSSAPIVVNVVGESAILSINHMAIDGERVDDVSTGTAIGNASARILWNFADAKDVAIGGTSQFVGSILVPTAGSNTDVTASTNGRLFVGGNLTTHGSGNEQHAYPWTGSPLTDCTPREENSETPDEGEENEVPGEEEPETPVEQEDTPGTEDEDTPVTEEEETPVTEDEETPVTEDETPQAEDEVVVEETEAPAADDAANAADEDSLPVTGANIGLVLPLAALLMILIGGGLALIVRTRSRA